MARQSVHTMTEAERFLFQELPKSPRQVFRGQAGLNRARHLLSALGNPQDKFPVIHIAGTSGKGTSAYVTASFLLAAGRSVGLHVSPHVYDFRERMQVNGRFISESELCRHINTLLPIIEAMITSEHGSPTYFEVSLALALLAFAEYDLDYMVIETGMGGLYDATNLISRPDKLVILTQIGFDHTHVLGTTIAAIAEQKAGIIRLRNHAIALWQEPDARKQFEDQAERVQATLEYLQPNQVAPVSAMRPQGTIFELQLADWNWHGLEVSLPGEHQVANTALAMRAVQYLAQRDDFELSEANARKVLKHIHIPARFEMRQFKGKSIILDGAHNPQKLASLARTLRVVFPGQALVFLIAMSDSKDSAASLKQLVPLARQIYLTNFWSSKQDMLHLAQAPHKLADQLNLLGFSNWQVSENSRDAFEQAVAAADPVLVIAGSFYFIGELEPYFNT